MELEVGMYVRTKNHGIAKIVPDGRYILNNNGNRTIYVDRFAIHSEIEFADYVWSKDIVKASFNIIDLIEVGDYVNGRLVCKNDEENYLYLIGIDSDDNIYEESLKDIKSIVTKEQFSSMEYRLGDE